MTISKSEFLGLVRAESAARKSTAVLAEKEKLRNEIESGIEKFLANGGQITTLKGTEIKPLPPRSIAESSNYIGKTQIGALIDWCKKGHPRRSRRLAIVERTGLNKGRVLQCLTPNSSAQLTRCEYMQIKAVLKDIEEAELDWEVGGVAPKPQKKRARQKEDQATLAEIQAVDRWCKERKGRGGDLCRELKVAHAFISQITSQVRPCSKDRYEQIKLAMKAIEQQEQVAA